MGRWSFCILVVAATLFTTASWSSNADVFVVKRDLGGVIAKYHRRALKMEAASTRVVIDGVCASACTAYLKNACATPKARIGFHRAEISGKSRLRIESDRDKRLRQSTVRYLDRMLASHYPPKIRNWISRKGGLPDKRSVLWLEGRSAQKLLGSCGI